METTTAPSTTPAPDDPTDDGTWIGGCALYVCGSIIINFGHCVIRLSHVKAEDGTSMWTNLLWVGGFMLFASGDVVNIAGLNMAAQSLLEALGSVQFISNLFFSVYLLRERLKMRHVVSTLLIVIGNILIVCWGDHKRQKITLTLIIKLLSSPSFLMYLAIVYPLAIAIGITEYCSRRGQAKQKGGMGATFYALSSAMIGANSVMVIKALAGLIDTYLSNKSPDKKPPSQRLVLTLVLSGVLAAFHISFWVTRLNAALTKYEALFMVPVLQASWITFTVLSGGIFFGELASLSPTQAGGFASGLLVVIMGVVVLIPPCETRAAESRRMRRRGGRDEVVDRAFDRGFMQAKALLDAGELEEGDFDNMVKLLARAWKSQQQELQRRHDVEVEEGYHEAENDNDSGLCLSAYESLQSWLDITITGDEGHETEAAEVAELSEGGPGGAMESSNVPLLTRS